MTIRIGFIGFGTRANAMLRAFRAIAPQLAIAGIVDPAIDKVKGKLAEQDRAVPFYSDLAELMRQGKPDALLIATRCHLHTPYAIEAAKYKVPIFLEKPVAINLEQALQLEEAFTNSDTPVLVSFPLRSSPLCTRARELIANGRIGKPVHFTAENLVPYGTGYFWSFYREYATTQGLLLQKATHDFDYLMYLADAPITRITTLQRIGGIYGGNRAAGLKCSECPDISACQESAENRAILGEPYHDHDCPFGQDAGAAPDRLNEDASGSLFEFASGAFGSYTQTFFTRREGRRGVLASGYEGTLSFDWYKSELKLVEHHAPLTDTMRLDDNIGHFGGDVTLAKNFLDMIRSGVQPIAPLTTGLQSVYVCLAARTAAQSGTWETVRQVGQCK